VHYGLIPEFVGRFPVVVSTTGLTLEQMVRACVSEYGRGRMYACVCVCVCQATHGGWMQRMDGGPGRSRKSQGSIDRYTTQPTPQPTHATPTPTPTNNRFAS
jgi:hypothetical protein